MGEDAKRFKDTIPTDPLSAAGTPEESVPDVVLQPGDTFADCEILDELGRGGMGAVYRARNLPLGRIVALKVLLPAHRELRANVARFLAEARTLAQLEHHNCVAIYRVGRCDGLDFIEMQYVEGNSAQDLVEQGPLEPARACRIVEQVARALHHAHRHGIIHRDVKPANILLAEEGPVKLVDFGLAKQVQTADVGLTAPGLMLGTPLYMAPEQWKEQPVSAATDLYSLGATFFHLLTGEPPFEGTLHELMERHLHAAAPSAPQVHSEVPPRLGAIVERLLAKQPEDRYPDAAALVEDLRAWEHAPASEATGPPGSQDPQVLQADAGRGDEAALARTGPSRAGCIAGGLVVGLLVLAFHALGWLETLELGSLDWRFEWSRGAVGESPVTLVVIDQESKDLLAEGQPLSREKHLAALLARLGDAGATAIGVDLLVLDRSTATEDGSLGAMTRMVPATVHAINLTPGPTPEVSSSEETIPQEWTLPIPTDAVPVAGHIELPVPEVAASARRVGHVTLTVDSDGSVRRVPLLLAHGGRVYPSLSLSVALQALGAGPGAVSFTGGEALVIKAPDGRTIRIPVDARGRMLVNFRWEERYIPSRPLWRVLGSPERPGERTPAEELAGKVVFVGSQLAGDYDVGMVPGYPVCPLVRVHALAADTILDESFVRPVSAVCTVILTVAGGLLVALTVALLRPSWATAITVVGVLLYLALCLGLFSGQDRMLLPVVTPVLAMSGGYVAAILLRYLHAEREKRRVSDALSRYLSPSVTRQLMADPELLELGGKRRELTILCVNLLDFHEISEQLEPEEVDELLGLFFERMTDTVFEFQGTVNRFSGYGLRALFGDPVPQPDHATRGVRCGLEVLHRARALLAHWSRSSRPKLKVGVGVHTGYVTVGNVGSVRRMEYTVIGRNVDVAEELARDASEGILVSARTASLATGGLLFDERDARAGGRCFEPRLKV